MRVRSLQPCEATQRAELPPTMTQILIFLTLLLFTNDASSLSPLQKTNDAISRRSLLFEPPKAIAAAAITLTTLLTPQSSIAAPSNGLVLKSTSSGLKWADAKVGSGQPLATGNPVTIDYSMASTAGRFPQIYSTKNEGTPYRWTLGDKSTIAGIEMAVLGNDKDGIPPMLPGGIRRVIVPSNLGYQTMIDNIKSQDLNKLCVQDQMGSVGPIPPKATDYGAYQRWAQFYCNPRIPYQPDLVLDVKLYGKR